MYELIDLVIDEPRLGTPLGIPFWLMGMTKHFDWFSLESPFTMVIFIFSLIR